MDVAGVAFAKVFCQSFVTCEETAFKHRIFALHLFTRLGDCFLDVARAVPDLQPEIP